MTPNKMKRRIASQEKTIARLREELRVAQAYNRALRKLKFAPAQEQERSVLVSVKMWAERKGAA